MKLTKERLKEIIKEELGTVQRRARYHEDASDETFEMVDAILAAMEPQEALENLVQALGRDVAQEHLSYIIQQYEIPYGDDEVVDYDPSDY